MPRFHLTTLGCPKNAVDSDKIVAALHRDGLEPAADAGDADLVVLNTCAFVEEAREESIGEALSLAEAKRPGAKLVVTGCMAERYGAELADALPEADAVVGFAGQAMLGGFAGVGVGVGAGVGEGVGEGEGEVEREPSAIPVGTPRRKPEGVADLLDLPRPAPERPWAYLKVAEGCDRRCAFCAIPTFRGRQVSRTLESVEAEAASLVERGASELVLVAQDIAWYGRDRGEPGALARLVERLDAFGDRGLARTRLLYLYPSEVKDGLVETILETPTAVPYFDLSLQHASRPLLRRMRRWGGAERFEEIIGGIRERRRDAVFRSSFIVGFPGETEDDHEELLRFVEAAELDWGGFFPFSREDDTPSAEMEGAPPPEVVRERIAELSELQEAITRAKRHALVGREVDVLVDEVRPAPPARPERGEPEGAVGGVVATGRTEREAPEIDGVVEFRAEATRPGAFVRVRVTGVEGPDLHAEPVAALPAGAGAGADRGPAGVTGTRW